MPEPFFYGLLQRVSFESAVFSFYFTLPTAKTLKVSKMPGHGSQWFSHKMTNQYPWQLKKSKSWELFWSYQLNSNADLANLALF